MASAVGARRVEISARTPKPTRHSERIIPNQDRCGGEAIRRAMDVVLAMCAVGLSAAMLLAWVVQRWTGSSGWIDTLWSIAVGVAGSAAALGPSTSGDEGRRYAAAAMVAAWSLRLGSYIAARTINSGEDPRYAALMQEWGKHASRRLLLFLQVQALAGIVLVAAIRLAAVNSAPFPRLLDLLAIVLAVTGLFGEALADAQLARFRRLPRARMHVCSIGLWRWSRHPNYFFEWLFWCAWPLLAIDPSGHAPLGWLALAAPILMYVLLVHVSGIPPLEAHMLASRGDAFRRRQARVNAFFPGPARSSPEHTPAQN